MHNCEDHIIVFHPNGKAYYPSLGMCDICKSIWVQATVRGTEVINEQGNRVWGEMIASEETEYTRSFPVMQIIEAPHDS
jgi:hypothetical protein